MPVPRYAAGAATGADSRVYLAGGGWPGSAQVSSTFQAFDPATGVWTSLPDMPHATSYSGAVGVPDGRIYVLGGEGEDNLAPSNSVYIYDPSTATWSSGPTMLAAGTGVGATMGLDGRIYVMAGGSLQILDPATGIWSQTPPPIFTPGSVALATGTDGLIYALAEANFEGELGAGEAEAYDPTTRLWQRATQLPDAIEGFGLATGGDARLYVLGGLSTAPVPTSPLASVLASALTPSLPLVESVSPSIGLRGMRTPVTIRGAYLQGATAVDFGAIPAPILSDSFDEITTSSPPGSGTVDVTVTTPAGISLITAVDRYNYTTPSSVLVESTAPQGSVDTLDASGYMGGEWVDLRLESSIGPLLNRAQAGLAGSAEFSFSTQGIPYGSYQLYSVGETSGFSSSVTFHLPPCYRFGHWPVPHLASQCSRLAPGTRRTGQWRSSPTAGRDRASGTSWPQPGLEPTATST